MTESASHDESLLPIRCPSCGQRFKVDPSLHGRTVECGSCEHRFKIEEEVIVKLRKFYPGEKKDPSLDVFQRLPFSAAAPGDARPVQYGLKPDPALIEPMSPQRILAGLAGAGLIAGMALLFLFGTSSGGLLDGMATEKRLMMAIFAALLGGFLLVYANPKARIKALIVSVLMGGGLVSLPFFFTDGSTQFSNQTRVLTQREPEAIAAPEEISREELLAEIGMEPLKKEKERLQSTGSDSRVVGVWLRNLPSSNTYLIRDYLLRVTGADVMYSYLYPRDTGNYLMVLSGIKMNLEEIARLAGLFGQVEEIYTDLDVVQIHVDNDKFIEGPTEKLVDPKDPAFYELNKRELDSIDLQRIKRAVQRLSTAEPKVYRADITQRFITLLNERDVDFYPALSLAVIQWSETPGAAGEAAGRALERLVQEKKNVPVELMQLLVREKNTRILPLLHELWQEDVTKWEPYYSAMGPAAESLILAAYAETEASMRQSATRILGKVGGPASIPVLEAAQNEANTELRIVIRDALKHIRERSGR